MIQPLVTIGSGEDVAFAAIAAGVAIIVLPITVLALRSVLTTRSREKTRRELAAYVAEGSIGAEQAVAFLRATAAADDAVELARFRQPPHPPSEDPNARGGHDPAPGLA